MVVDSAMFCDSSPNGGGCIVKSSLCRKGGPERGVVLGFPLRIRELVDCLLVVDVQCPFIHSERRSEIIADIGADEG